MRVHPNPNAGHDSLPGTLDDLRRFRAGGYACGIFRTCAFGLFVLLGSFTRTCGIFRSVDANGLLVDT